MEPLSCCHNTPRSLLANSKLSLRRLRYVCSEEYDLDQCTRSCTVWDCRSNAAPNLRTYVLIATPFAYQEYGTGKPIVLLAGGPGMNPAYTVTVAKMLASGGRRVLLLHQRGTGMSANAISCRDRMNLAGAIADLEALREHLHLEKLTMAGHSWGGMLAMAYAQKYPDRVTGLLLLDTGPMNILVGSTESANVRARLSPEER